MIALNLLRELDTLMRHTIAEASYTRSGATYAPTPAERRGYAAVDAMRVRLAAIEVPASGPPPQGRPGGAAPRPDELHAALAVAVDLCAAVVGHVPADAVDPIPAAALPIAPRRAAIA